MVPKLSQPVFGLTLDGQQGENWSRSYINRERTSEPILARDQW